MKMRSRYLIVLREGGTGAYTADQLLPGDISSAAVGVTDILRLDDLTRYEDGQWVPVPEGIAETPDLGEDGAGLREHFHPRYFKDQSAAPEFPAVATTRLASQRMDDTIAFTLLDDELLRVEALTYEDARALVGSTARTRKVVGKDRKSYRITTEASWNSKQGGDICILCSIDDGDVRSFVPIRSSIFKRKTF